MNAEKGRKTLCWWGTGCLMSVPVTVTSGWLRRYVERSSPPRQTLQLFIFQKSYWKKNKLNEKSSELGVWVRWHSELHRRGLQTIVCGFESLGRENRQELIKDKILRILHKCNAYETQALVLLENKVWCCPQEILFMWASPQPWLKKKACPVTSLICRYCTGKTLYAKSIFSRLCSTFQYNQQD